MFPSISHLFLHWRGAQSLSKINGGGHGRIFPLNLPLLILVPIAASQTSLWFHSRLLRVLWSFLLLHVSAISKEVTVLCKIAKYVHSPCSNLETWILLLVIATHELWICCTGQRTLLTHVAVSSLTSSFQPDIQKFLHSSIYRL